MLENNFHPNTNAAEPPQIASAPPAREQGGDGLAFGQLLAPLLPAIASIHRCHHQKADQVLVRFLNGFGAIISEYRLLTGIYEVAPVRFLGPEPDDYKFHFRSHIPDLTWCSNRDEMLSVCEQISRLLPAATV